MGFFEDYFVRPIVEQGVAGYNPINTPVYAILFALAVFGAYRLLKKLQIAIDRRFLIGIFPFLLFGGTLRVVRDAQIIPSPLLVSPIIYFVIFIIAVIALLAAVAAERLTSKKAIAGVRKGAEAAEPVPTAGISYHLPWAALGLIFWLYSLWLLAPIGIQNADGLLIIFGLTIGWGVAVFAAYKSKIARWFSSENAGLLWVHLFDASSTFTALQFFPGYYEQHVVSSALISAVGPAGQFLLKLIVVPAVLYLLDRELAKPEERQLRSFLKIAVLILGFAPGLRNTLRLGMGI